MSNPRITNAKLQQLVNRLNIITNTDPETVKYNTVGSYQIDWAYGQPSIVQITSTGGAQSTIIPRDTKRIVYCQLHSWINGYLQHLSESSAVTDRINLRANERLCETPEIEGDYNAGVHDGIVLFARDLQKLINKGE